MYDAVDQIRGQDYDQVVKEIEEMQNKSKRAYVRLYEKVGEDIGMNFLDKLDYMGQKESEADKLISGSFKGSSAQVELQRLQDEKTRIAKMQRDKEKDYLKSEPSSGMGGKTQISDLFRKYNL